MRNEERVRERGQEKMLKIYEVIILVLSRLEKNTHMNMREGKNREGNKMSANEKWRKNWKGERRRWLFWSNELIVILSYLLEETWKENTLSSPEREKGKHKGKYYQWKRNEERSQQSTYGEKKRWLLEYKKLILLLLEDWRWLHRNMREKSKHRWKWKQQMRNEERESEKGRKKERLFMK